MVNNARFLILPWIQSKGLASKILALAARRLPTDWHVLETGQPFVRPHPLIRLVRLAGFEPTTPWFIPKENVKGSRGKKRKAPSNRRNDNSLVLSKGENGGWAPHDLRRTGATMMQALGVRPDVIDRCQNHLLAGNRVPTVIQVTRLGRSTIYRMVASGVFLAPVQVGLRAVAWRWSDLDRWSASRRSAFVDPRSAPRAGSRAGAARPKAYP